MTMQDRDFYALAAVIGLNVLPGSCGRFTRRSPTRNTDPNYLFNWCGRGDLNSHVLSDNRF